MTDREKLRAEAVERWPNLHPYVVGNHEIADVMAWALNADPPSAGVIAALDELNAASGFGRAFWVHTALKLYHEATSSRIKQPERIA